MPRLAAVVVLIAAGPAPAADYLRDVKPVLAARCYACHGALQQKADLRLDTAKEMIAAGVVVPGKSADSPLVSHASRADGFAPMPPAGEGEHLTDGQVKLVREWIDAGATAPTDEAPDPDPRDHWSFRPPQRGQIPTTKSQIPTNPIDAFLAAEWDKRGLTSQPEADRRLLLRRVTLDLTGLPPTPDEAAAFLADTSPGAYERVVDRLLASPRYGERWGRHFLDVWRYSDWWGLGDELRNSQKHLWHWRDWTVESFNADAGYDRMVREMLAADELHPTDPGKLRATGYLARQYFKFNRTTWLDETVEHTAKAFLGLTVNCAKCHDHKYDPVSQTDYYRLRAVFEPYQVRTDMVPGEPDFERAGVPRAFDCNLDVPTYKHQRGDERQPLTGKVIAPGVPPLLEFAPFQPVPVTLPAEAHAPHRKPFVEAAHVKAAEAKLARAEAGRPTFGGRRTLAVAAAKAEVESVKARFAAERAKVAGGPDLSAAAAKAEKYAAMAKATLELAEADAKKRDAAKKALADARKAAWWPGTTYTVPHGSLKTFESNVETVESRDKPFPTTSTGRRTALANWLTDKRNPLTARVAVNHVWARHFGKPLVPTVFDLGRKGTPPTHPELLDWLAVEFMDHGWSLKHLHRLIVTSKAYRMTSSAAGETAKRDPENTYLWRQNPVRMEAQVVRDSLLHLARQLDPAAGGPSVPPGQQDASRRRSLYFFHSHNDRHKFLGQFDDANVLDCYRRTETIVPAQALALANSKLALTAADGIAKRITADTDEAFVTATFEMVLGSTPTAAEAEACREALAGWRAALAEQKHPDPAGKARANLAAALVNHNDFVTVR